MKNDFAVTGCRLHTKEKDKLVIIGYFTENLQGENRLLVQLDGTELAFEMEERRHLFTGQTGANGKPLTKEYVLWIALPEGWKKAKKFVLMNQCEDEQRQAYSLPVAQVMQMEKKIAAYVDNFKRSKEGFSVLGWYIALPDLRIQMLDMSGNELEFEVIKRNRSDVANAYPENSLDEVVGFEAVHKGNIPRKVKMRFQTGDKQSSYMVNLYPSPLRKYLEKGKKAVRIFGLYIRQYGVIETMKKVVVKLTNRETNYYKYWRKQNVPTVEELDKQREERFAYQPKFSIVIPLYKTPKKYLAELIESIQNQTYTNWELCLSDGSGKPSPMTDILKKYEEQDARIKVVYNENPLQISENTNAAMRIVTGDYVAFADHDDLLAPDALYECARALNEDDSIDMIYTDEDKVDMKGKEHFMPHFKSDFNIDMLRSVNYFCHLVVVKKEVVNQVGYLNPAFDGAQDYDYVLRCAEVAKKIKHIAKILYHWRAHRDSTAENPESKEYAFQAGARAIQAHYDRLGIPATVEELPFRGMYRSKYQWDAQPLISIVIPNKDHIEDLQTCISSIEERSSYRNYEFIIVENNSTESETFAYYEELEKTCPRAKVVHWKETGFNYPAINNFGVEHAKGEYILFLNNDTEIVNEDCLKELLDYCMRDDVGAVGARLYYEDGTVQHAGVVIGIGGVAGHTFVGAAPTELGYFGRIYMAQNYSAVTAACMMVKKSVFEKVGGFEVKYAVAFNDIDLCLKIRKAGYLIVYNPYAELNHYESKSRGYEDTAEKIERFAKETALFQNTWEEILESGDPYYNPNLSLTRSDFGLNIL
ncbi:MAG: glycosyltransferase family 2 protein [Faecalimonas sp.]|nr:glycosyltransferase family 2 protein [Faecalimonas sp.]